MVRSPVQTRVRTGAGMVRGSIESIGDNHISGWMHCAVASLRNMVVLAFIGERCIGSGKITIHREDLKRAGLGDGMCGFRFPIDAVREDEVGSIVVRIEGCDSVLLQRDARVVGLVPA